MNKPLIKIGIDPDIHKSGVAIKESMKPMQVFTLTFFELLDKLEELILNNGVEGILVVIEAGWLNEVSNYHDRPGQSKKVGEIIAKKVGANAEAGRKIVEMCVYLGLKHQLVRPTRSKMTSVMFERITGIKTKDQEEIDAGMLIV